MILLCRVYEDIDGAVGLPSDSKYRPRTEHIYLSYNISFARGCCLLRFKLSQFQLIHKKRTFFQGLEWQLSSRLPGLLLGWLPGKECQCSHDFSNYLYDFLMLPRLLRNDGHPEVDWRNLAHNLVQGRRTFHLQSDSQAYCAVC